MQSLPTKPRFKTSVHCLSARLDSLRVLE